MGHVIDNGIGASSVNQARGLIHVDVPPEVSMAAYDRLPPRIREAIRTRLCDVPPTNIEEELEMLRRKWSRFPGQAEALILSKIMGVERSWLADQPAWWRHEMAILAAGFRRLAQRRGRAAA